MNFYEFLGRLYERNLPYLNNDYQSDWFSREWVEHDLYRVGRDKLQEYIERATRENYLNRFKTRDGYIYYKFSEKGLELGVREMVLEALK